MITANFLGSEENRIQDDDVMDCLKEFANMVGGGYHAQMNDSDWRLGIPEVWKIDQAGAGDAQNAAGLHFALFGEPAGMAIFKYSAS